MTGGTGAMNTTQLVVVMVWLGVSGVIWGAQSAIRIVVFDQAGTPESTLRKASETASWMFGSAGVETDWIVCPSSADPEEHCALPPPGEYLKVFVRRNGAGLKRTDNGMGLSLIARGKPNVVCYVFLEPAEALAEMAYGSFASAIASTLAHEVGHLLGLKHTAFGIMKPKFERRDVVAAASGRLLFDADSTKILRASRQ
jgi:hypothetical protein